MELLRAVVVVVAVLLLLQLVVGLATCAAGRPGSVVDEVPAAVKEEAGPPPGSDVVGVGVVGAARCARHHLATAPRALLFVKMASMPGETGAGAHCRCRGALRTAGRDVRSEMTPATFGRMAVG
jgi:hypothetical protein